MILGSGIDIVATDRIAQMFERHGDRFLRRLLTQTELEAALKLANPIPRLAGRFAAKEAVMKALGTGWGAGVNFTQIEVVNDDTGAPTVRLHGAALRRCESMGGQRWHLSISHEREMAVAQAILEG